MEVSRNSCAQAFKRGVPRHSAALTIDARGISHPKSVLGLTHGCFAIGKTTLQSGHIAPEAASDLPSFVRDGDLNRVYIAARALQLLVDEYGLVASGSRVATQLSRYTRGVLIRNQLPIRTVAIAELVQ